jgi:hypothetical protein
MECRRERLRTVCGLEVPAGSPLEATLAMNEDAPPWLRGQAPGPVFEECLGAGDLSGAGLTLNSRGWTYAEVREGLARLAAAANDPRFDQRVEVWSSFDHERFGGY